jgi:microcystin-dependent protein
MKILKSISYLACAAATTASFTAAPAQAQSDPLLGQVMYFGGTFCPRSWVHADGSLIDISQNQALFALYGTNFGGDGRTTFGVPDLQGRAAIGIGTGPGLSNINLGQEGGSEMFVLNSSNLPAHNHEVNATNEIANKNGPGTDYLAITDFNFDIYQEGPPNKVMDPGMISNTGNSAAVAKRSPFLGLTVCIAAQGVFPPRN